MDRSRLLKLDYQHQPRGRRNVGRHRKSWKDHDNLELKKKQALRQLLFMFMEKKNVIKKNAAF
jgi:hypothetical protein